MRGERHEMSSVLTDADSIYELRVLFGPMFGVDLLLPNQRSLFVFVGSGQYEGRDKDNATDAAQLAINALHIPHHKSGVNFRIHFPTSHARNTEDHVRNAALSGTNDDDATTSEAEAGKLRIEWINGSDLLVENCAFNSVCRYGDIAFSVRPADMPWSDSICAFLPVAEKSDTDNGVLAVADSSVTVDATFKHRFLGRRRGAVCMATAFLAFSLWGIARYLSSGADTARVANAFDNGWGTNDIVTKNGTHYIIARTASVKDWDDQIALRYPLASRPVVLYASDLISKAEEVLNEHNIDYYTIRLDKVSEPELVLVKHDGEDNSTLRKQIDEASELLAPVFPFAKGVHIQEQAPADVIAMAKSSLTRIPVTFSEIQSHGYVTFFITGYVTDYALSAVADLARHFSHDWGHRKIRFSLALKTIWLNGKSRQTGVDGYILVDPEHWYFNNSSKEN